MEDCIGILHTKNEYRVAYVNDIDSLYGPLDDKTNQFLPNWDEIRKSFDGSIMFINVSEALDFAKEISLAYDSLEHGIYHIDQFKKTVYNSRE